MGCIDVVRALKQARRGVSRAGWVLATSNRGVQSDLVSARRSTGTRATSNLVPRMRMFVSPAYVC